MADRNVKSLYDQWKEFKPSEETYNGGKELSETPSVLNARTTKTSLTNLRALAVTNNGRLFQIDKNRYKSGDFNALLGSSMENIPYVDMRGDTQVDNFRTGSIAFFESDLKSTGGIVVNVIPLSKIEQNQFINWVNTEEDDRYIATNFTIPEGFIYKLEAYINMDDSDSEKSSYIWQYSDEESPAGDDFVNITDSQAGYTSGKNELPIVKAIAYVEAPIGPSNRKVRLKGSFETAGADEPFSYSTISIQPVATITPEEDQ